MGLLLLGYRTSDAAQPLDPHDPSNIITGTGAAAAAVAGSSLGSGTYKPTDPNTSAPQMQHANSYNMIPVQPYSPGTPGVDPQTLSGAPISGPYPSYQQPYGQA